MTSKHALAAAFAVALWVAPATAQDSLKIGAVNPYSGALALYGDEITRGYELAVDRPTRRAACSAARSSWCAAAPTTAQQGIAAVEKLVGRDKVDVLIGTYITAIPTRRASARCATTSSTGTPTRWPPT